MNEAYQVSLNRRTMTRIRMKRRRLRAASKLDEVIEIGPGTQFVQVKFKTPHETRDEAAIISRSCGFPRLQRLEIDMQSSW
jgi:hypothetical protein